ncbi:MAG: VirB4-like conjugal transfer ATPase, CD1110 family [Patescibacteria group bacterium]|jgi:conjugal transfer ATP-binding protein TraC
MLPFFSKQKNQNHKNEKVDNQTQDHLLGKQQLIARGLTSIQDIIAPPAIEVDFNNIKIGQLYYKTLFVAGYPRFVDVNWLAPLINFDYPLTISMYIYPVEGKGVLDDLKKKIGEMEAEIQTDLQRGRIANISTQVQLEDARALQEQLAKGAERFFQFGLYITLSAPSEKELETISKQVQSTLGSLLIVSKPATLQMEDAFKTTLPTCCDALNIHRNMDTTSLATTFPFTSSELSDNKGIMYGINAHNDSLIIFDRFSLENANSVVFAKSGAGKSYMVKLEILRSMFFDTEIIVIDPESEYLSLCKAVGGDHISFSFNSSIRINPFDLSQVYEEGENELGLKILSLHSLFKIIMGAMSPLEEAILDRALVQTYKQKGITPDPTTQKRQPPLLEDLYKVLVGMEEERATSLAARLEKFVKGSLRGIIDQHSNIDISNQFTVFDIKDLSSELRPIAMFIILDYIWTKIKQDLRCRILVVDEAWYLMQHPDSALFLYGMAKRARKYYLGVTTITQDVEDFLATDMGKAIVTNSSIQILLKQSPAAIDRLARVFYLSQGERSLLLSAGVGEGLFFAGTNHVAMRVVASPEEHRLITSNPQEILAMRSGKQEQEGLT